MMPMSIAPANHYWIRDDGVIYASASQSIIASEDGAFAAWKAAGNRPTRWPVDTDGVQTVAALQDVLTPYGLFADMLAYAANVRYLKEIGGITVNDIALATDDRSKQMIMGARVAADANPDFSTPWVGGDGVIYPLTSEQVIAISNAVLAHVASCFATFAEVKAAIDAGTIATTAEIDAAFA